MRDLLLYWLLPLLQGIEGKAKTLKRESRERNSLKEENGEKLTVVVDDVVDVIIR